MSILGVGPRLLIIGGLAAFLVIAGERLTGLSLALPAPYSGWAIALGVMMMVVGIFFWGSGGVLLKRAYEGHRLVTTGVYSVSRNPMYTGIIVFILPGLALVLNNLLLLLIPLAMIIAFKVLIRREEEYLLQEFGPEFDQYRRSVNQLLPFMRL